MATDVSTQKLLDDLKTVVRDGSELLKQSAGDLSEKGREARERLNIAIESARTTIERIQGKAIEKAKVTDKIIREHPYQSIGVAFGIGILIGVLVNRGK